MKKRTSRGLRERLKRKAAATKTPTVKKTISKTSGRSQVSAALKSPLKFVPRSGAKGLKATQVYPDAYGQKIAREQQKLKVGLRSKVFANRGRAQGAEPSPRLTLRHKVHSRDAACRGANLRGWPCDESFKAYVRVPIDGGMHG